MKAQSLPVAIIGAGPVGLAAAAHVLKRGLTPLIFEAGASVGASVSRWAHVRMFSPWQYAIDSAAEELLLASATPWPRPDLAAFPTGGDLVRDYLTPLAALPDIRPHLRLNTRVVSVTRHGFDKLKTTGRDEAPFLITVDAPEGEQQHLAQAVIDASGTYTIPNVLGANGVPALGERALRDRLFYGIPDVLGTLRSRYAGREVLVVGGGHSALNALLDLARLAEHEADTRITWAVRSTDMRLVYGGGANDELSERGALGERVRVLAEAGRLRLVTGVKVQRLQAQGTQIAVYSSDSSDGSDGAMSAVGTFDEIIVATGFRPDLSILSELRLALSTELEAPTALTPLIDPNVHSCGTVPPHGAEELRHPDANFYIVGMKSYGRAPTFLLKTGYEQVRSVVAAIAGDWEAARRVELVLPDTGVCCAEVSPDSGVVDGVSCCGPVQRKIAPQGEIIPLVVSGA